MFGLASRSLFGTTKQIPCVENGGSAVKIDESGSQFGQGWVPGVLSRVQASIAGDRCHVQPKRDWEPEGPPLRDVHAAAKLSTYS